MREIAGGSVVTMPRIAYWRNFENQHTGQTESGIILVPYLQAMIDSLPENTVPEAGVINQMPVSKAYAVRVADANTQCFYPGEAKGSMEMLTELQRRLPGFDNGAVIEAMGLMEGGRLVWSKRESKA